MEGLEKGIDVASKSIDLIDNILNKVERYQKLQSDKSSYLRLIYLEVINNLEVLQTINLDELKGSKPYEKSVHTVLGLLRTDMLESIFYKTDGEDVLRIYDSLKSKGKINNSSGLIKRFIRKEEEEPTTKAVYENVLQAISFVVTKIHLLKTLNNLNEEEAQILNAMKLHTRLVNITERLWMIKKKMDVLDEIKEMAR